MKKIYFHILVLIIFSSFLRFIWLDRLPTGISGDELDYVINAKSIAVTGKDISGLWSPLSISTPPYEVPKAELPYLIISPFIGPAPLSLFWARFPYALFSVLFVILLYLISYRLFSPTAGFIIGIAASINPWAIYFGRTAYDTPLAVYLYFFSLYLLLTAKNNKIFLSFPFFALAFFSYIGTKLIYLPFIAISITFAWLINKKKDTKKYLLLFLLCLLPFLFYIFTLKNNPVVLRTGDFININSIVNANNVNNERRLSVQTPMTALFSNKLVLFTKEILNNYIGVFSSDYLFLYGENSPFISIWYHGIFYYIDIFFLLVGFGFLFARNRKILFLFISIILIAPIPSIISAVGKSYSIRASIMYPVFIVIIGYGIWSVINIYKSKVYSYTFSGVLIITYSILVLNYLNILFFRFPIYSSEAFGFSGREIVKYITLNKAENKNVLFIDSYRGLVPYFFKQYLFYANRYDRNTAFDISQAIKNQNYAIDNFKIADCPTAISENTIIIAVPDSKCSILKTFKKHLTLARLADGGGIYSIYNDVICSKYVLKRFPFGITLGDLKIEDLTEKQFCEKFITDL